MAKEIRTHQVCKDIKALDKAKAVTGHMKHAYIRTKESTGQAQMQGQESETPTDYAENRMAHGADRVIHEAVRPIRQQGRKKKNQRKEIRRTVEIIKQENGEGHTSGKEHVPLFLRHRRGNFTRPKAREQKIKMHRQGSSLCHRDRHSGKPYSRQGSEKHRNKPYGGRASEKLCSGKVSRGFQKLEESK